MSFPIFRQYIPVRSSEGGSNPDPAVYCPANGYIIDPSVYVPDPVVNAATSNPPDTGEITLTILSDSDRHTYFRVTTSTGSFRVKCYDPTGTLVSSLDLTSGSYYSESVPSDYEYYRYVISAVTGALTSFRAYTRTGYASIGAAIVACLVNCTTLTTCDQMFYGMQRLRYCEFLSAADSVTTFYRAFYNAVNLEKIVMPSSANAATTLADMCYNTTSLVEAILPASMNALSNASQVFYNSSIRGTVTFPSSMPALTNLSSLFYGCSNIRKVTLPASAPLLASVTSMFRSCYSLEDVTLPADLSLINSLSYTFYQCYKLKGEFIFPELTACLSLQYAFTSCYEVTRIEFTGAMNACTNIQYLAQNCKKLTYLGLPESLEGITYLYNTLSVADNCSELIHVELPKYLSSTAFTTNLSYLFGKFAGCTKLQSLSKILSSHNSEMGIIAINDTLKLTTFDQPNLRNKITSALDMSAAGGALTNSIRGAMNYVEVDWSYVKTNAYFRYLSIGKAEAIRILNALPVSVSDGRIVSFAGCPCVDELNVKTASFGGTAGSNAVTLPAAFGDITGYSVMRGDVTYSISVTITTGTNLLTTAYNHGFSNGRKVAFTTLVAACGINANQEYYVINASGNSFQLSESEGGAAITLSASTTGKMTTEVKVESMTGTTAYLSISLQTSSFSTWFFTDGIDYYDVIKKGWLPFFTQ